jgi:hypothetical protein
VEEGFFLNGVNVYSAGIAIGDRIKLPLMIYPAAADTGVIDVEQALVRTFPASDSVGGFFIKQCFFVPFSQLAGGSRKALVSAEQSCKTIEITQTSSTTYAKTAVLDELPLGYILSFQTFIHGSALTKLYNSCGGKMQQ